MKRIFEVLECLEQYEEATDALLLQYQNKDIENYEGMIAHIRQLGYRGSIEALQEVRRSIFYADHSDSWLPPTGWLSFGLEEEDDDNDQEC